MKGFVTPVLVWGLTAAPLVFAVFKAPKKVFMGAAFAVCGGAVAAWVATAGYGYGITENMTNSLGGHIYIHKKGEAYTKGDLVAFRFRGGATYPRGETFIKRVVGVPGDVVRREGREFWVGSTYIGKAKEVSKAGVPLEASQGGVIPEGHYFVTAPSPDSLDSRYTLVGNVKAIEVIGRAHEVF